MNSRTFTETITASNCTTSLAHTLVLTLKMADNTNYVSSLRPLNNLSINPHAPFPIIHFSADVQV